MTITTTSPSVSYVGDGVSVDFAIPFPFYADGDVRATVGGAAPVFTVGGTYLRFAAAPAAGAAVRVFRVTPRTQLLDLYANGAFPAEGMETALDRIVMMVQELEARLATSEARIAAVPTFPAPATCASSRAAQPPGISAATRERVQRAAQELSYRPNLAARSMRTHRTGRYCTRHRGFAQQRYSQPLFRNANTTGACGARGDLGRRRDALQRSI